LTVDARADKPGTYEVKGRFTAGGKRVAVAFVNAHEDKEAKKFREFGLQTIVIDGPSNPVPRPDPASVKLLLVSRPGAKVTKAAAAEAVLRGFAGRAGRRQ